MSLTFFFHLPFHLLKKHNDMNILHRKVSEVSENIYIKTCMIQSNIYILTVQ